MGIGHGLSKSLQIKNYLKYFLRYLPKTLNLELYKVPTKKTFEYRILELIKVPNT
jgi:hypothetical protein